MNDITYTIHTKNSSRLVPVYHTGGINQINRGETTSLSFDVGDINTDDLTVSSNHTVADGTTEYWGDLTIENNATLTINGTLRVTSITNNGTIDNNGTLIDNSKTAKNILEEFIEWAGSYKTLEGLNGEVFYDDTIPTDASIDSLLIGIEPSDDLENDNIIGIWGLVENINDERTRSVNEDRYRFDVLVLGEYTDYSSHNDVETNLGMSI